MTPKPDSLGGVAKGSELVKLIEEPHERSSVVARAFPRFTLKKRIDTRSADELQNELLQVREVALDTPHAPRTTAALFELAPVLARTGTPYPGPMIAAKGRRDDLSGLPFRSGTEAVLTRDKAETLDALSRQLRDTVHKCIGPNDPRPNPDLLYAALLSGAKSQFREGHWATAAAVPCIQQMLQPEGCDVRRMSVELLRGIADPAATETLVRWAVFDIEADVRAAAVDAQRPRDRVVVAAALLQQLRYPWPRAAEHAAEALVELNCREVVADLAAALALPDPDAAISSSVPGQTGQYRREMVRVNHLRNCALCHAPAAANDLVRGAVPDRTRPLPAPNAYYSNSRQFVSAATSYLRQDFSVVQPVASAAPWPRYQRYDYLISFRSLKGAERARAAESPYRRAILFALRELTGRDLGPAAADWQSVRAGKNPRTRPTREAEARFLTLAADPKPFAALVTADFTASLVQMTPPEWAATLARFYRVYGSSAASRMALVAYLESLVRRGDAEEQRKAKGILDQVLVSIAGRDSSGGVAELAAIDVRAFVRMLDHENPQLRAAAAAALGARRGPARSAIPALIAALKDRDADVRQEAALALAELGPLPDAAYEALGDVTADAVARVRLAAAQALWHVHPALRSAAPGLAAGLFRAGTWDSAEQQAAFYKAVAGLLAELGPRAAAAAYPRLAPVVSGTGKSAVPSEFIVQVFGALGRPPRDNLGELVQALGQPAYRAIAQKYLLDAGDAAVRPLIGGLSSGDAGVRKAVAEILGRVASLSSRNSSASRESWRAALDALAATKTNDKSAEVRAAAADAIKNLTQADR